MTTPTPTSTDLLLARQIQERAVIRRKFDIKQAIGVSGTEVDFATVSRAPRPYPSYSSLPRRVFFCAWR